MSLLVITERRPLLIGRVLEQFSIESVTVSGGRLAASGEIRFKDVTEPVALQQQRYQWYADCRMNEGEMAPLDVRVNNERGAPSAAVLNAIATLARDIVPDFVVKHPETCAVRRNGEEETTETEQSGLDKPEADDTSFPSDWASKLSPTSFPPPRHPRLPIPPQPPVSAAHIRKERICTDTGKTAPRKIAPHHGPQERYNGPCVCAELSESGPRTPFDWHAKTGGKFPRRCFECSCGRRWWCSYPDGGYWNPVPDRRAWLALMENNGVPTPSIVHLEEEIYHQETLLLTGNRLPFHVHHE